MKNLFVPFELAKQLKEKGFPQKDGFRYYSGTGEKLWNYNGKLGGDGIIAPTHQQVTDFLRDKHDITVTVSKDWDNGDFMGWQCVVENDDGFEYVGTHKSYYEALNIGIETALKLI